MPERTESASIDANAAVETSLRPDDWFDLTNRIVVRWYGKTKDEPFIPPISHPRVPPMESKTSATSRYLLASMICVTLCHFGLADDAPVSYSDQVVADRPVAYWTFEQETANSKSLNFGGNPGSVSGTFVGAVKLGTKGPQPPSFPLFGSANRALSLDGAGSFIRVTDLGEKSFLDFSQGDSITLEAWVNPVAIAEGQQVYIIGKGRTQNPGVPPDNQNYALRLRGIDGTGRVSFLFRSEKKPGGGTRDDFHRWNSHAGITPDSEWHHVAVVYTFGTPESIRAYVDGQESKGEWDIGGATTSPPVVDDDELWIGSSMGGNPSSSFQGSLDEVAIYRHIVPAKRLQSRYQAVVIDPRDAEIAAAQDLPADQVLVELFDKLPANEQWLLARRSPTLRYTQDGFGFVRVPNRYLARGVLGDWSDSLMLRARSRLTTQRGGPVNFLLRYKSEARLYVDGSLVAKTNKMSRNASGHESVPKRVISSRQDVHALPPGMQEQLVTLNLSPGDHIVRLDAVVGGKGVRLELGDLSVAFASAGQSMQLLTAPGVSSIGVIDDAWQAYRGTMADTMRQLDTKHRRVASAQWREYWQFRHELARDTTAEQPTIEVPQVPDSMPIHNEVDHFIGARLVENAMPPAALTGDLAFLRRVTLDTVGVVPSLDEINAFLQDARYNRRAIVIDRLLADSRWADHWVGYWQDVLAENPGILKPKLNNTGPFRWWIHESFLDNKPMDQFVTELVLMEGSKYAGGPAGFGMATENDAPMAAKAHVLAQAFLGLNMKCARCHDAPYHPFKQEQLFNLAAMLNRKATKLPKTSTVPIDEGGHKPLIEISLKPGVTIEPVWPFSHLNSELASGVLNDEEDHRERLAASITSPGNKRFAKVMANRLWHRYLGRGLVEPLDDWESESRTESHPVLLDFLAREFVLHDYDFKHLARLILNSHAYQREPAGGSPDPESNIFAAPARRRMSAEQLVDSLFVISGKQMDAEALTLDPEGRRPSSTFLNLGVPRRSWQFTSLSNERDRPALALPMAQNIIDLLVAYGWRDARPNPISVREEVATMLQPLMLSNGVVGRRAVLLSDDHAITHLCLQKQPLTKLVDQVCLQVLSRMPTRDEAAMFVELLAEGYESRVLADEPEIRPEKFYNPVSWSNHLSAEATRIKQQMERAVRAGDPPTKRLVADWRQRMEDLVWSLINSPEFVFLP
jgi:hypothetical protein